MRYYRPLALTLIAEAQRYEANALSQYEAYTTVRTCMLNHYMDQFAIPDAEANHMIHNQDLVAGRSLLLMAINSYTKKLSQLYDEQNKNIPHRSGCRSVGSAA